MGFKTEVRGTGIHGWSCSPLCSGISGLNSVYVPQISAVHLSVTACVFMHRTQGLQSPSRVNRRCASLARKSRDLDLKGPLLSQSSYRDCLCCVVCRR